MSPKHTWETPEGLDALGEEFHAPTADAELAATAEGCSAICVVIALAALCWAGVIGFALFVNGLVRL